MEAFYEYCESQKILFTSGYTFFSLTDEYKHHFRAVFADKLTVKSTLSLKMVGENVKSF